MALPTNYSTVTVFGRYIDFTGAPMQGTVTFTPSQKYVTNPGADVLIFSAPLVATLDETGAFSIEIPTTDDPDVFPQGFTWTVTESFNNRSGRSPFAIAVPETTPPPGIDLVTVAPVLPADEVEYIVTSLDGMTGAVSLEGKYAPLGEDGKIPVENIPSISSGVTSVNGASGVVSLGAADVGALPITGGTMQGPLNLHEDPTDPSQAATKAYVDTAVEGVGASVTSVNGEEGAVVLSASDVGALGTTQNLSDLTDPASARTHLGLTAVATASFGTGSGNVAAGDDSRITGALQSSADLSDLTDPSAARTNLGLGPAATLGLGTTAGTVAAGDDSRFAGALQKSANLSDLTDAAAARTSLGLGTSSTRNVGTASGDVAAGNAPTTAVTAHTAASDPHGDRAYADGRFLPLTGGTVSGNVGINGSLTVGGVGQIQFARKTADESVVSSTTLQNDNHLVLPVVANATYTLFLMCIFSGATTGDIKFDWTVPSGTVLRWSDQTGVSGLHSDVDVYSAPGGTTQVAFQIWATVVTSSTAGNVQFRWAQNASDATATIVRTNSSLQLTRVA
ncbi:hypothetical protein ACH4FA_03915 [Streptomyces sp. NPDC017966]|uniref:hypothetical protein n=1 Tax=Streptomyces sp. NPDC017966 TaxID=3365023 RepID=UPI0037A05590